MITTYTWTFNPLEHEDLDSLTKVVKIIHRQVRGSDGKRNSGTDYTNTLNIVDGNVGIGTISTEIVIEEADQSSNNKKSRIYMNGDDSRVQFINDALSGIAGIIKASRDSDAMPNKLVLYGQANMPDLRTSSAGLSASDFWNGSNTVKIVT